MNVLIVDKNAEDRELLRSALEHHGCAVIEAIDGLEGLDCAIHQQPDIIVSNTLMPHLDGFQLLWALKSDPKLTSIPFLFYSDTYAGQQEEKLAQSIGAGAFIVKKDGPEKVWERANEILLSGKTYQETSGCPDIQKNVGKYLWDYARINATKLHEKVRELEEAMTQRKKHEEELRILNEELALRIAELQQAVEAVREKEQEIGAIFEVAPFAMLLLDGERKVRRANTAACSFTDISAEDMIGRKGGAALRCIHALNSSDGCGFGPSCRQCALRLNIIDTFETGKSYYGVEVSLPLSNNHHNIAMTFLISTTRVTVENQNMVILGIQDITGQKQPEKQLRQTRKMESAGFIAGKKTILLAEDDESVRNMAMALLQYFGYEVITAIDGEDAIAKYKEHAGKIHLLLFDLVMPQKTGKEAYDEIRKLQPDIKVMFTSGYIQEIAKEKILADPHAAFILKPYLPTFFMQKVQNILDEAKP